MTTTVKVEAHCNDDTKVRIAIDKPGDFTDIFIVNGETYQTIVHGDIQVTVHEMPKE